MSHDLWLAWELTRREIGQRYKGMLLGLLWPILYSLLFLGIFSFVFTFVLKVEWVAAGENVNKTFAAVMIFCGMVPYLFISEVLGRSPVIMIGAHNLIKRVRFPVEIIPVVNVNAAMLTTLINLTMLLAFAAATGLTQPIAPLYAVLILIPLYLFALGLTWLISSVTVFFRDLIQIAPVVMQILLFMAPVFYPASAVPEEFRTVLALNPLTYFVEANRAALSGSFDMVRWLVAILGHTGFAILGYTVFQRLKPAFGDLL